MFESMGIDTGVDIDKLIAAREPLKVGLPDEPIYGMLAEAGLPKGFQDRQLAAARDLARVRPRCGTKASGPPWLLWRRECPPC